MAESFQFIDNSSIKGRSRKLIRSHVMKGKNAGKIRPQRSRRPRPPSPPHLTALDIARLECYPSTGPKISLHLLAQLHAELSGFRFPCLMTPSSSVLFRQFMRYVSETIYIPEFCMEIDSMRSIWFQYALEDEAYFHCFMAMAAACISFAVGSDAISIENRRHFSQGLRLVNHKLSGADAISDTAFASVMALGVLASMQDDTKDSLIHFNGLCRMIEFRGGMEHLQHNYPLVEKAHRIDIDLALRCGTPNRLPRLSRPVAAIVPSAPKIVRPGDYAFLDALQNVDLAVAIEGREMMEMIAVLRSSATLAKLNHFAFEDIITSLCYRLIAVNPISAPKLADPLSEAIHLGLVSFMTTMLVQFGGERRLQYELLADKTRSALDNPDFLGVVDPATHLWLLVMAGVSVIRDKDRAWLLPKIAAIVDELKVRDWTGALNLLGWYPWLNVLHDKPARELWNLGLDYYIPRDSALQETENSTGI